MIHLPFNKNQSTNGRSRIQPKPNNDKVRCVHQVPDGWNTDLALFSVNNLLFELRSPLHDLFGATSSGQIITYAISKARSIGSCLSFVNSEIQFVLLPPWCTAYCTIVAFVSSAACSAFKLILKQATNVAHSGPVTRFCLRCAINCLAQGMSFPLLSKNSSLPPSCSATLTLKTEGSSWRKCIYSDP